MDFEQLHLKTVELLASKVGDYGLSTQTDDAVDADEAVSSDDVLIATSLASALNEAKDRELPLAEKQEAPEIAAMRSNIQRMRSLRDRISACNNTISELRSSYNGVTARTSSLHEACDRALAFQTALAAGAEQIRTNLHFFKQADIIMRKLNNTAKLSLTGQAFTGMLASIDECLSFLRRHPEYKESEAYIAKYELCLSRAMTWIRVGVLADIDASVNDVRDKQAQLQVDYDKIGRGSVDDDTFALLYGVFASKANSVRSALAVAEQRFANVAEFQEMLNECQHAYFMSREQLLWPIIQSTMSHILNSQGESTCALTRTACTFILTVCSDEFRLYRQFFATEVLGVHSPTVPPSRAPSIVSRVSRYTQSVVLHPFEEYIESMCRLLYDMLRPIVVHNPHLETLAELCTMLRVEMIEERCSLPLASTGEESLSFDPRSGFVRVMGELVGDIAERIVFRAASYGASDIAGYKPAPGDLAYPQKLEMMRNIESSKTQNETESNGGKANGNGVNGPGTVQTKSAPISAVDLHCLWYPTVRRTVMCLAKLFKCLDMAVFQSLARDLLTMACDSLETAVILIAATTNGPKDSIWKPLDAHLFIVKHLLILREQTTPYRQAASNRSDATLPTRDFSIDFTKMKNSFLEGSRWFELSTNNAFLEILFSVPIHVQEQSGDSRLVLDTRLRSWCNHLINTSAAIIVGQLTEFIDKAEDDALRPDFDLKKYPALAPGKLNDLAKTAFKSLSTEWIELRSKFSLYIGVNETETILLAPVKKKIMDVFSRVNAFANRAYDDEGRQIAALPTVQQVHLLLNND